MLILPEAEQHTARAIAERIRQTIETTQIVPTGALTISIGVAGQSVETPTPEAILKRADEHLYQAKHSGRNRVVG